MNDFLSLIKSRRSIRIFQNKKIEPELIAQIIEAGHWAPSHCNTQGWRFVVVDKQAIKNEIVKNGGAPIIKNAPCCILITYDTSSSENTEYQDWIQSSSAAIQNMLLATHSLGLGGCWICHLPNKKTLQRILSIPQNYSPVACIILGYPQKKPSEIARKNPTDQIFAQNSFPWAGKKNSSKTKSKKLLKKIYFFLPSFLKRILNPITEKLTKKFEN